MIAGGWVRGPGHSACWVSSTGSGTSVGVGTLAVIATGHRRRVALECGSILHTHGTGAGLGVARGHRGGAFAMLSARLSLLLGPRGARQVLWPWAASVGPRAPVLPSWRPRCRPCPGPCCPPGAGFGGVFLTPVLTLPGPGEPEVPTWWSDGGWAAPRRLGARNMPRGLRSGFISCSLYN